MVLVDLFALLTLSRLLGGLPAATGYSIDSGSLSLSLRDVRTDIDSISTLFVDENAAVVVDGVVWEGDAQSGSVLHYETFVNDEVQAKGKITLPDDPLALPTSFDAGEISATKRGKTSIEVKLTVGDSVSEGSLDIQAIAVWMSSIPFIVAVLIAIFNSRKELSLLAGIFLGSFMVKGSLAGGFVFAINRCLVDSLADISHAYIYLFAFGMSGLVGMIRRSGGLHSLKEKLSQSKRSHSQRAQLVFWVIGLFLFFDQYASSIIVGELLSSFLKSFPVSVEKLAFIVDSTAAPVASIVPGSSWAGVLVPLIQTELDRIIDVAGTDDLSISTTGFTVLLKSMKYQFYSFFMILMVPMVILAKRDVGPMLIAERTRYVSHMLNNSRSSSLQKAGCEKTEKYTHGRLSNFLFPVIILNAFLWISYGIYVPGTIDIENYPSYPLLALVASVAATVILTQLLFLWPQRNSTETFAADATISVAKMTKVRKEDRVSVVQSRVASFHSEEETLENGLDKKPPTPRSEPVQAIFSKVSAVESVREETFLKDSANQVARSPNYGDLTEDGLEVKFSEDIVFNKMKTERGILVPTANDEFGAYDDEVEVTRSLSLNNERIETMSQKIFEDFDIEEQKEEVSNEGAEDAEASRPEAVYEADCQEEEGEEIEVEIEELAPSDYTIRGPAVTVLTVQGTIESFGEGGGRILYILLLLTLAWAIRILFTEIGFDRTFAMFLTSDNIKPELLPSLVFGIALVVSLVVRSAFGTVAILLPLVSIPAYQASLGNPEIFYGTIGALFSGAIAGEHMGPISDSTLLTCLATKCDLTNHTLTQTPYALFVSVIAWTAGTLAVSHGAYPVIVAYPIGIVTMIVFIFIFCCPIIEPKGNFDIFTELYCYCRKPPGLDMLRSLIVEVSRIEENEMDEEEAGEALARVLASHATYELATSSEESGYSSVDSHDEFSRHINGIRRYGSQRTGHSRALGSGSYSDDDSSASGDFLSDSVGGSEEAEAKIIEGPSQMRSLSSCSFLQSDDPESKEGESYETSFDDTEGGDTRTTYEKTRDTRTTKYGKVEDARTEKTQDTRTTRTRDTRSTRSKTLAAAASANMGSVVPRSQSKTPMLTPTFDRQEAEGGAVVRADSSSILEQNTFLMSATFRDEMPPPHPYPEVETARQPSQDVSSKKDPSVVEGTKKQGGLEKPPLAPAPSAAESQTQVPTLPARAPSPLVSLQKALTRDSRVSAASLLSTSTRGADDSTHGSTYPGESDEMSEDVGDTWGASGTMESLSSDDDDDVNNSYDTYGTRPSKMQSKFKSKTSLTTKRCDRFYF